MGQMLRRLKRLRLRNCARNSAENSAETAAIRVNGVYMLSMRGTHEMFVAAPLETERWQRGGIGLA